MQQSIATHLAARGTTVIMPQFDVQTFLKLIPEERINSVISVPAIYWLAIHQSNFADIDTSRVRWVAYGGARMPPDLITRILEAFPHPGWKWFRSHRDHIGRHVSAARVQPSPA